jgi:hypothetical protein
MVGPYMQAPNYIIIIKPIVNILPWRSSLNSISRVFCVLNKQLTPFGMYATVIMVNSF